jgi:hypothetical protein
MSVNSSMERLYRIGPDGKLEYLGGKHPYDKYTAPYMFNPDETVKPEYRKIMEQQHQYFESLMRKYRHAASHPWESVEPDPPRPR